MWNELSGHLRRTAVLVHLDVDHNDDIARIFRFSMKNGHVHAQCEEL